MTTATKPNHIGRKISRIRELRGMKQEALAEALNISQQAVSKIEQTPEIEDDKLEEIAKILGVTHEENKKLYERLLQAEQDKNEYLEKLLNK